MEGKVGGLTSQTLAYSNCIYVHPEEFRTLVSRTPRGVTTIEQIKASGLNVWVNHKYVFAAQPLEDNPAGTVGMGVMHRLSANLALGQHCSLAPWFPDVARGFAISTLHFEVQALLMRSASVTDFDCEAAKQTFERQYVNQAFTPGQFIVIDMAGKPVKMCVTKVDLLTPPDAPPATNTLAPTVGLYVAGSSLSFTKGRDAPFKLLNQSASGGGNRIFKPDFDFSKLGIGGLDKEFNDIFRRAFASRVFPPSVIEKLGIKHVRGMLLFGPPGCGKTLIARQIGKVLNAKEPKVVNGPEIFDKFVGEAERKIRELFADARKDQEELGDDSELHIIIFDEIDAICKARGSSRDGTGVGDSVVNQLLTQIDGVDSLNNVLVIGMTNRKDMLDEALLRPGRLEVQVEINLPDEFGRAQILTIHTSKARENRILQPALQADLDSCLNPVKGAPLNLAQRTKNFSGAEIEGLVRAATAHALSRGTDGKTYHAIKNFTPEITLEDFELALSEIKPKFGAPQDTLEMYYRHGLVSYGPAFDDVRNTLNKLLGHVKTNANTSLMSVMLHGKPGAGKTALAAACAVASEYPLVRYIKVADMIGRQELAKSSYLYTIFEEAYRSTLSMIIIDDMERLMEYVANGPRFSNSVLQTLLVMIKNPVPVIGRKLFIVGITSSYDDMHMLGLTSVFDVSLEVPLLAEPSQFEAVLADMQLPMQEDDRSRVAEYLGQTMPLGVKKLLAITEMARQDMLNDGSESVITYDRFIDCVYQLRVTSRH
ncbi:vesicle-fusing ATPase [Thraustotheca clavata]|uniref:Vesicle-fusing ATPase n=1 Tax=Thraustotheca clavata TaxID=74557 RepID=A0A1V9Z555_9STRA|nr:vesicle-fusing ATPase [Thraustotheca clavata]